ncbi:hypothetical protein [Croceicoccus sp. YJ47]|uniref:hypothetical protein n=1 Tax=Croceicoccus sp. YJ47 TaxID=2798724 RepID=UPI0019205676|nr:hypothetical protein [Croceicoccus sp. YJ47]QQN75466.1 hypothetical protein JD971_07560 [Croceicoccus sp. YJ47]
MTRAGVLVAAWTALALAALIDVLIGDEPEYVGPPLGLHVAELPPAVAAPPPVGVTIGDPPFGAGTLLSAPQADRVRIFAPIRFSPVPGDLSALVKLWIVNTPPRHVVAVDMDTDESFVDLYGRHRIVLARGCFRLDDAEGPLLAFSRQAGLLRDDANRLAIGAGPEPQNILRVGAEGLVYFESIVRDAAVERRWHAVCGAGAIAAVSEVRNIPICRNSREEDARLQAAYDAMLTAEQRRASTMRDEAIDHCMARGGTLNRCQATVPPPPPMPSAPPPPLAGNTGWPELPSNRQEECRYPS